MKNGFGIAEGILALIIMIGLILIFKEPLTLWLAEFLNAM